MSETTNKFMICADCSVNLPLNKKASYLSDGTRLCIACVSIREDEPTQGIKELTVQEKTLLLEQAVQAGDTFNAIQIARGMEARILRLTKENEELKSSLHLANQVVDDGRAALVHQQEQTDLVCKDLGPALVSIKDLEAKIIKLVAHQSKPNYFHWAEDAENSAESVSDLMDDAPIGGTMLITPVVVSHLPSRWYAKTEDGTFGYWETEKEADNFCQNHASLNSNSNSEGEL